MCPLEDWPTRLTHAGTSSHLSCLSFGSHIHPADHGPRVAVVSVTGHAGARAPRSLRCSPLPRPLSPPRACLSLAEGQPAAMFRGPLGMRTGEGETRTWVNQKTPGVGGDQSRIGLPTGTPGFVVGVPNVLAPPRTDKGVCPPPRGQSAGRHSP